VVQADERHQRILGLARLNGRVDVVELAGELDVSLETVRRDLRRLEEHGFVRRTHGGAYPVENAGFESDFTSRTGLRVAEKQRIARAAVGLLSEASSVFIDEGFTPQLVEEELFCIRLMEKSVVGAAPNLSCRDSLWVFLCLLHLEGKNRDDLHVV